jgi:preprotein translocase subunit SecF
MTPWLGCWKNHGRSGENSVESPSSKTKPNTLARPGKTVVASPRFFRLVPNDLGFDYLRWRWWSLAVSWTVIAVGVLLFLVKGFNYGIDFTGGTLIQVQVNEAADIGQMRSLLDAAQIGSFTLQSLGEGQQRDYLIVLGGFLKAAAAGKSENLAQKVEALLKTKYPSLSVRRVESVGPKVGQELKQQAFYAIGFSLLALLLYIWLRFEWRFGIGALVATAHDVLIVLTAFVLTQKEITLTVVAAVLTVAGFSVNDTVVIFDRIRENMRRHLKRPFDQNVNDSINQTLSRTVLTSGTVLIVVIVMYLFGGEILNDFAFALLIGILVGTYSSIFQAAPVVYMLHQRFPPRIK